MKVESEKKIKKLIDELVAIEQRAYKYPWTASEFQQLLNTSVTKTMITYIQKKPGAFIIWTEDVVSTEVVSLAVDPIFQGKGCGARLLKKVINMCNVRRRTITLKVRVSNVKAINMYLRHGFQVVRVLPAYWLPNGEDAYEMRRLPR